MRLTARAGGLLAALVVALSAGSWLVMHRSVPGRPDRDPARAPLPHPVRVEVHNTTRVPGIARAVTERLRHAGLDVVQFGSADSAQRGRTRNEILVRRGDTSGVGIAVGVLGRATVIDAPDSSLLVDLTILLGTDFLHGQPPPRP